MPIRRTTIRRLYREAIRQYFGSGDKNIDRDLENSLKKDVHIAGQGPGQWVSEEGVLEIYCESGIPNASDIHDTPYGTVWNSEKWFEIDDWVNLALEGMGHSERVHYEPFNGAVVGVYWL